MQFKSQQDVFIYYKIYNNDNNFINFLKAYPPSASGVFSFLIIKSIYTNYENIKFKN